jgi:hypothetical protein
LKRSSQGHRMRHIALRLLLFALGVIISLALAFEYGIHAIIFAWFMSIEETTMLIARTYLFRQIMRPISKRFTEWIIVLLCGRAAVGRTKVRFIGPIISRIQILSYRWNTLPPAIRILTAVGLLVAIGLSDYWVYLIVFAAPLGRYIYRALHLSGMDLPFDRWVQVPRKRVRRFLRTNFVCRVARMPWRRFVYCILKRTETAREQHWWKIVLSHIRRRTRGND